MQQSDPESWIWFRSCCHVPGVGQELTRRRLIYWSKVRRQDWNVPVAAPCFCRVSIFPHLFIYLFTNFISVASLPCLCARSGSFPPSEHPAVSCSKEPWHLVYEICAYTRCSSGVDFASSVHVMQYFLCPEQWCQLHVFTALLFKHNLT